MPFLESEIPLMLDKGNRSCPNHKGFEGLWKKTCCGGRTSVKVIIWCAVYGEVVVGKKHGCDSHCPGIHMPPTANRQNFESQGAGEAYNTESEPVASDGREI